VLAVDLQSVAEMKRRISVLSLVESVTAVVLGSSLIVACGGKADDGTASTSPTNTPGTPGAPETPGTATSDPSTVFPPAQPGQCIATAEATALADLTLPTGADAVLEYEQEALDDSGTPKLRVTLGNVCATATDRATCQAAVAKIVAPNGPPSMIGCGGGCWLRAFLVTTSGDTVRKVDNAAGVVSLFGPVTSQAEAALVLQVGQDAQMRCAQFTPQGSDFAYEVCGNYLMHPDGTSTYVDGPLCAGRLPEGCKMHAIAAGIGGWLASMAELEAAAVEAFERMVVELRHHGAPAELVARAEEAREDEIRHARAMGLQAARFGGTVRPHVRGAMHARDLEAMAVENAVEGCVRETFGAILAAYQARAATDAELRRELACIAVEEARHAQLSWDLAAWLDERLDAAAKSRIETAREDALRALRGAIGVDADTQGAVPGLLSLVGLPPRQTALALYDAAHATLVAA